MTDLFNQPDFKGSNYVATFDCARLTKQIKRVLRLYERWQGKNLKRN